MNHVRSSEAPGAARNDSAADVAALTAAIASSSIRVASRPAARSRRRALEQFDDIDIEILEWIASHLRGKRRSGWLM